MTTPDIKALATEHARYLNSLEQRYGTIPDFVLMLQSFANLLAAIEQSSDLLEATDLADIAARGAAGRSI